MLLLHPTLEIDELLRLVISQLIKTSSRTIVSLALSSRSLEEPTLSSIWEIQYSLTHLLKYHIWIQGELGITEFVVSGRDYLIQILPLAIEHRLCPNGKIPRDTLSRLPRSSAGGVLFPRSE